MIIRRLGCLPYETTWTAMKQFTSERTPTTSDELWLVEHPAVYTQGQAGKPEHVLHPDPLIPVIQSDRGGQITYHGPGQMVAYVLIDLVRINIGIRKLVCLLEQVLIDVLQDYEIEAERRVGAPGVYVESKKIASIGLRVKKGCTYHGVALNVDMDLSPFKNINPCGYQSLEMTQIKSFCSTIRLNQVQDCFIEHFLRVINANNASRSSTCLP